MTNFQVIYWTIIFFLICLVYFSITEPNFSMWLNLQYKIAITEVRLSWYRWWLHPRNPISRWVWNRRLDKMTKKFTEEK